MSSRKRKRDPELELSNLSKKLKRLERVFLRGKRKKRIIESSTSDSESISCDEEGSSRSDGAGSGRDESPPRAPAAILIEDPTSREQAPAPGTSADTAQLPTEEVPEFDENILKILGDEPSLERPLGKEIHKSIATRFEHVATNGLDKETMKELLDRYLIPRNSTKIDAPALNPEIKPVVTEVILKRLRAMESKQKQTAAAITALGEAITVLLSRDNKDDVILKLLMDAARIVCDCQYKESLTRRGFILSGVKKEMKEQMKDTKIGKLLFGEDLAETLKTAKAIQKSGADLKPAPTKKASAKSPSPGAPLNWKAPPAPRRPAPAGPRSRAPAPAPAPAPTPRGNSSKSYRPRHSRR